MCHRDYPLFLLVSILYHTNGKKSIVKIHKVLAAKLCKVTTRPGAPDRNTGPRLVRWWSRWESNPFGHFSPDPLRSAYRLTERPLPHIENPRSVHPHFQGLCVVFGLLSYIPSARLTEQLAFPPLRLCGSAESDLITSVGLDFRPSLLHLYYTTKLVVCQGVLVFFFNFGRKNLNCGTLHTISPAHGVSPLDTYIISQNSPFVNRQNAQNFRVFNIYFCAK